MSNRTLTKRKQPYVVLPTSETDYIMKEVDTRFEMLEDNLEGFKREIRDTFLAMELSLEALRTKMAELQTELLDWHDDIPTGSVSKH